MNRRSFLRRSIGAFAGVSLLPFLPKKKAVPENRLTVAMIRKAIDKNKKGYDGNYRFLFYMNEKVGEKLGLRNGQIVSSSRITFYKQVPLKKFYRNT